MATTFNFELNNKPTRNKTYVILLRVTQNKKHKRTKTSIELKSKNDFNPKAKAGNWIRTSEPNHKVWNESLENELEKAKSTYRELRDSGMATKEKIVATMVAGEKSTSFLEYAKKRTQEIFDEGGYRNYKKYNGFYNKLENFLSNSQGRTRDLTFAELTPSLLARFESHLKSLTNERHPDKKLHPNTIAVVFNIFRTLVNRSIEIDGLIKPEKNPFMSYSYKGIKTVKAKLNESEMKALEELPLPEGTPKWNSRNYFLFSFYCAGVRVGDFIQLRWSNIAEDGRLVYQMDKNHKIRNIKLIQKAKDILALYYREEAKPMDYIFPLLDNDTPYAKATDADTMLPELRRTLLADVEKKTSYINKYLKQVAKEVGITKTVSFHIARHTFARIAKDKNIDNAVVQGILAHERSDTTDRYMGEFETSVYDQALETIFEDKKAPQEEILSLIGKLTSEERTKLIEQLQQ